jgi:chorismate mutase
MPTPFRAPESANGDASGASRQPAPPLTSKTKLTDDRTFDLKRRRDQLNAKVAELQWDLGGMVYEMAIRDQVRVDVIVKRAAALQEADAELQEVERILRLEETGMAGACANCGSPHSTGASFCWQCGQPLLAQVPSDSVASDAHR